MSRKTYTEQFKLEAAQLVTVQGMAPAEAAARVGVDENVLNRWVSKRAAGLERPEVVAGVDAAAASGALPVAVSSEIAVAQLRQEISSKSAELAWLRGMVERLAGLTTRL